ncbi:MAG TPA: hypothetical protein VLH79_06320 [Chthonomonadales bacterium]|nr:hypothetical protein [Chthonomonadales bacterium]
MRIPWIGGLVCAALALAPPAVADRLESQGRTGLPVVREGKRSASIRGARVVLRVEGRNLRVEQFLRLAPAPSANPRVRLLIAVRETDYRAEGEGGMDVRSARGFDQFRVTVDGQPVRAKTEPWKLNTAGDTATRWRVWPVSLRRGGEAQVRIHSMAPLSRRGGRYAVEFTTKDLGHWLGRPRYLEVRMEAPGDMETRVAGVEPVPTDVTAQGLRWVRRNSRLQRDVMVLLPSTYRPTM